MGNVIKFQAQGREYPLSILDVNGDRWVAAQQVGEALGNSNIYAVIKRLIETHELIEGRHHSSVTLDCSKGGKPRMLLSYRGVIRVAMRSQGSRAKLFRDWAEEVLLQVMLTGSYVAPEQMGIVRRYESGEFVRVDDVRTWRDRCIDADMRAAVSRSGMSWGTWVRVRKFRDLGLSQDEAAAAFGTTRHMISRLERYRRRLYNDVYPLPGTSIPTFCRVIIHLNEPDLPAGELPFPYPRVSGARGGVQ